MKLIAGNWKMHLTHLEAIQAVQKLSYRLTDADFARVEVVVCPPFTALRSVQTVLEADRLDIKLGAQNCHWEAKGAYTGEVSPEMLRKLAVSYVIVGHSERRAIFGETDEVVARKVRAVFAHGMTPILCVGETLAERDAGITSDRVHGQLRAALGKLGPAELASVVVAYEPVWSIGTGRSASPDDAQQVIREVKDELVALGASTPGRVVYGGSVSAGNVRDLMAKSAIDGALVGGASVDPDEFARVCTYWTQ